MTDSEEEDYSEKNTGYGLEPETQLKIYNFKHSYLYEMAWSDLNDHYAAKLAFYIGQCAKRIVVAYALVFYAEDGCLSTQYLMMCNVGVSIVNVKAYSHSR